LPTFVLVGFGTSIAALLGVIAHFSLSRKGVGFLFRSPLHSLHGILRPSGRDKGIESGTVESEASLGDKMVSEESVETMFDAVNDTMASETNHSTGGERKLGRIIIPAAVDSIQQEAIVMLKKLEIIEDDIKADELCTRREYARWLVRANSQLERNPKHRIAPSVVLAGSTITAFDDVNVEDPDFGSIQSLAEAGIVRSKLLNEYFGLDDLRGQEDANFFPERFLSRQDLIKWKAKLEYESYDVLPGINEEIFRNNVGFMDMREISSEASEELFVDMLAGNKSILRKVFGQAKRFQPNKPSTKAQAAVALTSGRMKEAIHAELSRLEAENSLRKTVMDEIHTELLARGDIQSYWDKKMEEEKGRGLEVEGAYNAAVHDLEEEKIVQESTLSEFLKKKAAIDCQKQLLSSLEEEVNEMSERFAYERAKHLDEQHNLQGILSDLQVKHEGMLDVKSILEAEKEALRILRSWIEDEARKSQARAKVLEEVGRRWKW
ncbi:unnamed protein product, partial [Ilex paraguariensis]